MSARPAPLWIRDFRTAHPPRRRASSVKTPPGTSPDRHESPPPRPPVVYVVDDDDAVRTSLRFLAESVGLRVRGSASAADFLTSVDPDAPGCVLLDLRLPDMNGIDLLEVLRNDGIEMPAIVVTAYADVTLAVRAMRQGAFDFLEKPVSDQLLLDQVQQAVALDVGQQRLRAERRSIRARLASLSRRERQVAERMVGGLPSRKIAAELGVRLKTVESHRASIMKRVGAESLAHLIRMWLCVHHDVPPPSAPLPATAPVEAAARPGNTVRRKPRTAD